VFYDGIIDQILYIHTLLVPSGLIVLRCDLDFFYINLFLNVLRVKYSQAVEYYLKKVEQYVLINVTLLFSQILLCVFIFLFISKWSLNN
jgi:hypothetical protein